MQNYLEGLNEPQRQAALQSEGPLLIVAGAGAGKTKTITHRIARLIADGIPAREVLAVTFTNKAAGEMRERIRGLVPQSSGAPMVSTFHALGVRLLREFHQEAGLPRGFSIWDRDDSNRCIKRALEALDIGDIAPRAALSAISRAKGDGETPAGYTAGATSFRQRSVARAWEAYERALSDEGALDFDDLLVRTLTLLGRDERVRTLLQERWRFITIDEYQDTNRVQYEIARLLAGQRRNICVVGDIDQNIYSWRGADIAHLLSFERDFPGARVITLEQNYRSTRAILSAANAVIAKNVNRLEKKLFTENEVGEPLTLYAGRDDVDEAWFIAMEAKRLIAAGTAPADIAVLYRENFQSRAIEEALLQTGVAYRVVGTRFFERAEVKDALSYLRAALNPKSFGDIARVAGTPARGIGKTTLAAMREGKEAQLGALVRAKIARFRQTLEQIAQAAATLPASEALHFALEVSGLEKMHRDGGPEGSERLENLEELGNLASRYDFETPPEGIEHLLEQAALESDQDELSRGQPAVFLLTVHASKGLEFDAVFIAGLEQGLFPHESDDGAPGRDPEEERRLFYVALTRARKRLYLSLARIRMRWGQREMSLPSEFLDDIDPRLIQAHKPHFVESDEEDIID